MQKQHHPVGDHLRGREQAAGQELRADRDQPLQLETVGSGDNLAEHVLPRVSPALEQLAAHVLVHPLNPPGDGLARGGSGARGHQTTVPMVRAAH